MAFSDYKTPPFLGGSSSPPITAFTDASEWDWSEKLQLMVRQQQLVMVFALIRYSLWCWPALFSHCHACSFFFSLCCAGFYCLEDVHDGEVKWNGLAPLVLPFMGRDIYFCCHALRRCFLLLYLLEMFWWGSLLQFHRAEAKVQNVFHVPKCMAGI